MSWGNCIHKYVHKCGICLRKSRSQSYRLCGYSELLLEESAAEIKYIIYGINIFCGIVGLAMASFFAITVDGFRDQVLDWCLIGLVVFIIVINSFGCCGTYQESKCLMWTYTAILVIILNVQIILHLRYQADDLVRVMTNKVDVLWSRELKRVGPMSALEREFQCCGLHGFNDYVVSNITIPSSCYKNNDHHNSKQLFRDGCWDICVHSFTQFDQIARLVNEIIAAFELVALILSFFLAKKYQQMDGVR